MPDTPNKAQSGLGLFATVNAARELVEHALLDQFGSKAAVIGAVGEHVFGAGGKRMRPALLLLAAELCGYTGARRIHMGVAIELLHTATLLHDDVVDVDDDVVVDVTVDDASTTTLSTSTTTSPPH